jgi:hypothetical protein
MLTSLESKPDLNSMQTGNSLQSIWSVSPRQKESVPNEQFLGITEPIALSTDVTAAETAL